MHSDFAFFRYTIRLFVVPVKMSHSCGKKKTEETGVINGSFSTTFLLGIYL